MHNSIYKLNINMSTTFKITFHADFGVSSQLDLKLTVVEKESCYDISYIWSDPQNTLPLKSVDINHPAYPLLEDDDMEGVIVYKNGITTQLIEHLVMNDEDLEKVCGNGTANDYRVRIIRSLATFWD